MSKSSNQTGFTVLELLIVLVILSVIGLVGLKVVNSNATLSSTTSGVATQTTKIPTKITSTADLQQASTALDQTQIDSQLDPTSLDTSIKSLL